MNQNSQKLSLAYSPCPNDTYIFFALAHGLIPCENLLFDVTLADVETLNQQAKQEVYDITKLSFAAMGHVRDRYALLRSGAALGRGCGPLIVAKDGTPIDQISTSIIAVPGRWTTAALLLGLYLSHPPKIISMPFDQIMPAVASGNIPYGVIIHEGRFTYPQYGLVCLLDLGEWWEQQTSLPIPLGGICIRRNLSQSIARAVENGIRESIRFAKHHPKETETYIRQHAQEMEPSVIHRHIDLYVNEFSIDLTEEATTAIEKLFEMAEHANIIPTYNRNINLFA